MKRTLPVLFLGVLVAALDIALVAVTLPAIQDAFSASERAVSWVLGAFVLFTLAGLPLMTRLSDVYGRRKVFLADLGLFGAGLVVVLLAPSLGWLLVGRCIQGLGASGMFPVASAVIGDAAEPERRGRMLGLLGSVYGIAFIIGPILGGILVGFGWRYPFAVNLVLAVGAIWASSGRVPDVVRPERRGFDPLGVLTLTGAVAALALGLNQIETTHLFASLGSPTVWPLLAAGVVLAPAFLMLERRSTDPVLSPQLLLRRQVLLVCLFAAGAGMTEALFVFLTDYAASAFAASTRTASFMLLPLVFAVAIGSPLAGRLLDRTGSRVMILFGLLLSSAGMARLGWGEASPATFYGGTVLIGLGLACLLGSALSYILLAEAARGQRAAAQGINTIFISIGQLVGSALIGALASSAASPADGYRLAFRLVAAIGVVQMVFALLLRGRQAERASASSTSD